MAKRIHLVCNAHLDPVWQWEWEEGAAETLSTFRIAADFCEEYDDLVFCHNEAILYEWVSEYDPVLFDRIQKLVKAGKWHIMGGWHLQPDCNMPSGEALVRQIFRGRRYFKESFGAVPTVALNADPFGHSRGLVQIMAQSGYEGYLFMRPEPEFLELPDNDFRWVGYDGSSVIGIRMEEAYSSNRGKALEKIRRLEAKCEDDDFILCMWGVGDHGGGPSRKDLNDIVQYKTDNEIIHSTPEAYLAEVKSQRGLQDYPASLNPRNVGCYTSMIRVKQKYRDLENMLFMTERICSHASSLGLIPHPQEELDAVEYDLLTMQFHDILPGSSIQAAEEMALRTLDHGLETLSRIRAKAFFALSANQPAPDPDAIPIMIYNPYPYALEDDFSCELILWDQVRDFVYVRPQVYQEGIPIPTQCEKEDSTIPIEWRKRVTFRAKLAPMSVNRFDCKFETLPQRPAELVIETESSFCFDNGTEAVRISKKTGLVEQYQCHGTDILKDGAFRLDVFSDDSDPWGMNVPGWKDCIGSFTLLSQAESDRFSCVKPGLPPVRVIENGPIRTVVEALFGYQLSRTVVRYTLSKTEGMQVEIRVQWSEKEKLLKLSVPAAFPLKQCIGEQPYGSEALRPGLGEENCAQKYVIGCGEEMAFAIFNNGTYGLSYDEKENRICPTLLRSPVYCAHPVDDRIVLPQNRYSPHIDQGERIFRFGFAAGTVAEMIAAAPRKASEFNEGVFAISFYPAGNGMLPKAGVLLEGSQSIQLTAFKKAHCGEGYILRLFNSAPTEQSCKVIYQDAQCSLTLSPFRVHTLRLTEAGFTDSDLMEGLLN